MALIFGTQTDSVEVKLFNELKADAGPAYGLKGLGDYRSLYVNNNDHESHRPKHPEHRTVEFMCGGDWEISHGGARNSAGRQGPVQVAIAAIRAGTPELQCKNYEDFQRLLEAAAKSGDFVPNPAYDEEEFKALPKQEQTSKRKRTMKYMQGPDGLSLREEVVVKHNFLDAHSSELKQLYEEAFINLFEDYPPPGWMSGRAPARAYVSYNLPAAVIADPCQHTMEREITCDILALAAPDSITKGYAQC
eukprot:jgi/Astpho2/7765/Aster-07604